MKNFSFAELFASAGTGGNSLKQGEFLFQMGDISTHLYTVLDGSVRLVRYSREGDAIVMHTARSGDNLAEASLFSDTYHCDAEAVEPSTVACYDKQGIMDVLQPLRKKAWPASPFFPARSEACAPSWKSVPFAPPVTGSCIISCCMPIRTPWRSGSPAPSRPWAHDLAMAHETLYRTLAGLEKEGKISRSPSVIRILP